MEIKNNRLAFLDFLRFIAAFSVLIQHVFEKSFPAFMHFTTYYFQFGLFGVILFFLTSGFIIPVSLEKGASLKIFWINRLFRLYPLYILSIISVLLTIYLGAYPTPFPDLRTVITNLFMFQHFLGKPDILSLYWTLCLELSFYFIISVIFILGYIKKSVFLALLFLGISFLAGVVAIGYFHLSSNGWGMIFYLSTMFMGTLFYRLDNKEISFRTLIVMMILATFVLLSNTYMNLYGHDRPEFIGASSFIPVTTAIIAAYIVFFTVAVIGRNFKFPRFLVFLGVISYSIYLVQGTIITATFRMANTPIVAFTKIAATILISYFTYRLVEKTFIEIGKKLGKSLKKIVHVSPIVEKEPSI